MNLSKNQKMLLIVLAIIVVIYFLFFRNKDESKKESSWIMSNGDRCKNPENVSIVSVGNPPRLRMNCAGRGWDKDGFAIQDAR
jgi:hypothetical protein